MQALTTFGSAGLPEVPDADTIEARLADHAEYTADALSDNTRRAIRADTAVFSAWCRDNDCDPLPASPETVARFVDAMAETRKPATVRRYVSSIAHMHGAAELPDPTKSPRVKARIKAAGKKHGTRQRQARALTEHDVVRILDRLGDSLMDLRDRALLMVSRDMFARRSEVVSLDVEDLDISPERGDATVLLRRSKTDQLGEGAQCLLAADTVRAVRAWLVAAEITEGRMFRALKSKKVGDQLGAHDVGRIFKRLASLAGIDPTDISGHSARVGSAQDLTALGATLPEIQQRGRWKSAAMPARYSEKQSVRRGRLAAHFEGRNLVA